MKKKVINVEYRKTSETFPDWMKYEVTILKENGDTEKIPAYGKDLQDALSRVVHDDRLEKIQRKTQKLPYWFWVVLWFLYLSILIFWHINIYNEWIMIFGMGLLIPIFTTLMVWTKQKNIDKPS